MNKPEFVQLFNPVKAKYVKVSTKTGRIVDVSDSRFEGIEDYEAKGVWGDPA